MSLSPAFLDELRARTSLTTLIARTVKLVKAGREMKGCCPFHGEKTPSFYVNDDKGFYHCFGCSAHGDAIRWLVDNQGMQFLDAVRELAAAAGMDMPERDPRHAERDAERDAMLSLIDKVARIFVANLASDDVGIPAREYLHNRGLGWYGADGFDTGWAVGGRQGPKIHEQFRGGDLDMLVRLGVLRVHQEGERKGQFFDFFRGRVMFPIHDARGRVIAFGGRVLGDGQPKYLNSPDTPIFDKGATLYNIHRAAPAARAAKRLLVVEGYMDVIGLARVDVLEAVAPNGTALTEAQIAKLWRIVDVPVCCFDGDNAGRAAAARAALRALPMLEPGKSLSFVYPPAGSDPDQVARDGGREAVDQMLAQPISLADVLWSHERDAAPCNTPEQVARLKARLRDHVRSIRNGDVRQAYGQDMARRFAEAFDAHPPAAIAQPRRAARQAAQPQRFERSRPPRTGASKRIARDGMAQQYERAILAGLLHYPAVARSEADAIVAMKLDNAAAGELRDRIVDAALADVVLEVPDHLAQAADFARATPLRFSFTTAASDDAKAREDLADAIFRFNQ